MDKKGQIITFYSYKGGTGRSMSLANIAYLLGSQRSPSNKTLLIDWDLEAPGLHRFFNKQFRSELSLSYTDPRYEESFGKRKGLIDYLGEVKKYYELTFPSKDLPEGCALQPESIAAFNEITRKIPIQDFILKIDDLPDLHIMKAGSSETDNLSYSTRVRQFDWEEFFTRFGSFFFHLKDLLMREFDYVFIDSRTGVTDTSGICTRLMPEKLVAVFVPNRQNIDGIKMIIEEVIAYREKSRDPRGLIVFPLASRIDSTSSKLRDIWWRGGEIDNENIEGYQTTFENLFKKIYGLDECSLSGYFAETQINYDSDYAFGEKIASIKGTTDRLSIGFACNNFLNILLRDVSDASSPWSASGSTETSFTYKESNSSIKRLVICCDGAWNNPAVDTGTPVRTNVQKLFDYVLSRDQNNIQQIKYYDEGRPATGTWLTRILEGATGKGIDDAILDAYKNIVWNYNFGDELYFFGFSRGAYVVRSLVGLIRKCGIVKKSDLNLLAKAYQLYRNHEVSPDSTEATLFRRNHSFDVPSIKFIGVWDTVGALGIPLNPFQWINKKKYSFYDTTLSSIVEYAYHAISIDEERSTFKPTLWEKSPNAPPNQVLEQRWFAGVHSNVGGGYPDEGLSDIALQWMIEKALAVGLGLDTDKIAISVRPNVRGTLYKSRIGIFKLLPSNQRFIPNDSVIHSSVFDRLNTIENYRPKNLAQYKKAEEVRV